MKYRNTLLKSIIGIFLVYNLLWFVQAFVWVHNPLPFIMGGLTQNQFLARKLDYYPAYQWLDNVNREKKPVLLVGEYRPLYLKAPNYTNDYFDTPVIVRIIHNTKNMDEIYARLAELHVSYILYNENETSKYLQDYYNHFYSDQDRESYLQFLSDLALKSVKRFDIHRDISQAEVLQIRKFMKDPARDPRSIYIFKL